MAKPLYSIDVDGRHARTAGYAIKDKRGHLWLSTARRTRAEVWNEYLQWDPVLAEHDKVAELVSAKWRRAAWGSPEEEAARVRGAELDGIRLNLRRLRMRYHQRRGMRVVPVWLAERNKVANAHRA